ncbi:MAG: DUF4845 domain-containing protein [Proteobacteria bacterium]|nr:MAG: DUF4845 domain-containing protein [Pseudomonadota bacterium]
MNRKSRQRGVTMWGMLMISLMVVFFALLLFKLIPPYLQDLKVKTALDSIEKQAGESGMSNPEIMVALRKRFDIDDIEHIDLSDITIERRGVFKVINIEYEAVVHLVLNISALMEFNHSAEIPAGQ